MNMSFKSPLQLFAKSRQDILPAVSSVCTVSEAETFTFDYHQILNSCASLTVPLKLFFLISFLHLRKRITLSNVDETLSRTANLQVFHKIER